MKGTIWELTRTRDAVVVLNNAVGFGGSEGNE